MSLTPRKTSDRKSPVPRALPVVEPSRNPCGPETITSLVREIAATCDTHNWIALWDDPLQRKIFVTGDFVAMVEQAYAANKPIAVTVEKLRGRWTTMKLEVGDQQ